MPHRHIMATHLPDCVQHYTPLPQRTTFLMQSKLTLFMRLHLFCFYFLKFLQACKNRKIEMFASKQLWEARERLLPASFIMTEAERKAVECYSSLQDEEKKTLMGANRAIPAHLPPSLQQALPNLFFSFFFFFWQMINKSFPLERFVRLCWICLPPFWAGEAVQTWASILPHTSAPSLPPALTASISLSPTNTHTRRTMHTFAQHRCPPLPLITALLLWSALQLMCALLARCWINCAMLSLWMAWVSAKPCNPPHPRAPLHNFWLKLVQRERAHMHPCAHTDPCGHTSRCSWSTEQLAQSCDAPCAA